MKRKKDIEQKLECFESYASYDQANKKHYLVFEDNKRGGKYTLMKYQDGTFTVHGIGENYCDDDEVVFDKKSLLSFIWENRKAFSKQLNK